MASLYECYILVQDEKQYKVTDMIITGLTICISEPVADSGVQGGNITGALTLKALRSWRFLGSKRGWKCIPKYQSQIRRHSLGGLSYDIEQFRYPFQIQTFSLVVRKKCTFD